MACNFPTDLVIVVGGGLAGVSACNTVVENGGKTVLIDKSSFCGGNSTKATSGINGAATKTQKAKGIEDSSELFIKDTLKGGAKKPEIAKVLCANSGADVEWLMDAFNLDLSLVARLGGHSAPRTHRGAERFPGMTITYALIQMVEKVAEMTDKARIITKAKATKLLTGPGNKTCLGLEYEKGGLKFQEHGPVILCTGGFGADFTSDSLLAKYRPDLLHLPTTNGEHCTGDGIKMGEAIGAKTIDLEWVQVHPTGLVKPDDADAKIKFLAAEALRGVGGLILNKDGKRFANELGRRDYVTGEMWKNKPPFRLCLNKAASDEIIWHCKHYTGRGVMKFYENGEALAKDMGVPLSVLEDTHKAHFEAAKKTEKDPDGGSYPAYPSGKSWDEASGTTGSGKKFYHNIIPGTSVKTEPFYVAIITPVIHYCMGGLEIDADGAVIGKDGSPIKGLYCAGEVAGGVHGNNRLGGNSLLDCVVFGRVTGQAATKYILGGDVKKVDLKELTKGGLTGEVKASKFSGGSYEDNMNDRAVAKKDGKKEKAPKEKKAKSGGGGGYDLAEVAKHTTKGDCWVVVSDQVLNVTSFLSQHPGGELAILTFAGKDATEEFNMIHPPDVISKYAPDAVIGMLGAGGGADEDDDDDDDDDEDDEEEEEVGGGGYTLEEVAKHTTKGDCWVVVSGQVLNVTSFLSAHPGGELAILTFAGKDATEEFNMIHPPDVISKYAPDAIIGQLGAGGPKKEKKEKKAKGKKRSRCPSTADKRQGRSLRKLPGLGKLSSQSSCRELAPPGI
jgi:flavocytochrome c